MKIKISDIRIAGRKRKASPHKVRELADSINRLGLLNPVTISSKKELIAGLHRLEAHKLLGLSYIEAHIKDFNEFKKELAEIDENLIRNELSILDQGEMILERDELLSSMNLRAKSGRNKCAKSAPLTNVSIASELGISKRTLLERKQIARNLVPEVKDKLIGTRYAYSAYGLLQLARQPEHIQKLATKKILNKEPQRALKIEVTEPNIIKMAITQALREYSSKKYQTLSKKHRVPESIQICHGDFRDICRNKIPNGSVDLILTDPPYAYDALPLFKDLADVSYRLLKPSGFLVSYVGTLNLPHAINYFREAGLEFHWVGTIKFKSIRTRVWNRRVFSHVRYFLIFYKPPRAKKLKFFDDFLEGEGKEKDFHIYQQTQSNFEYLVGKFSEVGDTVLEPFGGSGTTALACYEEGRKCIIIEKDKKSVAVIKARIAEKLNRET